MPLHHWVMYDFKYKLVLLPTLVPNLALNIFCSTLCDLFWRPPRSSLSNTGCFWLKIWWEISQFYTYDPSFWMSLWPRLLGWHKEFLPWSKQTEQRETLASRWCTMGDSWSVQCQDPLSRKVGTFSSKQGRLWFYKHLWASGIDTPKKSPCGLEHMQLASTFL